MVSEEWMGAHNSFYNTYLPVTSNRNKHTIHFLSDHVKRQIIGDKCER